MYIFLSTQELLASINGVVETNIQCRDSSKIIIPKGKYFYLHNTMNHTQLVLQDFQRLGDLVSGNDPGPILLTGRDLTISQVVSISRYVLRASLCCVNASSYLDTTATMRLQKFPLLPFSPWKEAWR